MYMPEFIPNDCLTPAVLDGYCADCTAVTWDFSSANYTATPVGWGGTAVLGLPDTRLLIETHGYIWKYFQKMLYVNRGYRSWPLVAFAFWMTAVPEGLLQWMDDGCWFNLPLVHWVDNMGDILTAVRRSMSLPARYHVLPNDTLHMRKLLNMTYREKVEADWAAEEHRRTINVPIHYCVDNTYRLDRKAWRQQMYKYLRSLTSQIVNNMVATMRLESPSDWWASRYAWAPKGSSSLHRLAEEQLGDELDLRSGARANKKAVNTILEDDFYEKTIKGQPFKNPRTSTKPEAGKKARALYAQDDASFCVASYASVGMEKYINIDGIYAQQAPSDVAEWVKLSEQLRSVNAVWQSLDYSDFNSDHEATDLALLDLCFAQAWLESGLPPSTATAKAEAALWTSRAHLNAWVTFGGASEPLRVHAGLFSGDRNTARDNSILHAAYSHISYNAAKGFDSNATMFCRMLTGDDEDAAWNRWTCALAYQAAHSYEKFVLKSKKQLIGMGDYQSHEYLQRTLTDSPNPQRPLAATLAQLISGNWYDDNYIWFDGIINSVNSNCWELCLRGLPHQIGCHAAAMIFHRTLSVISPKSVAGNVSRIQLEWWDYRTAGAYSPLWDCVSLTAPLLPTGEAAIRIPKRLAGVEAWVSKLRRNFPGFLPSDKAPRYAAECKSAAMSCFFPAERNRYMHTAAANNWPERYSIVTDVDLPVCSSARANNLSDSALRSILSYGYADRHPNSYAALVSRFGMDLAFVEAAGGIAKLIRYLKPAELSQWENLYPTRLRPQWAWCLDPSLASWVTEAFSLPKYVARTRIQAPIMGHCPLVNMHIVVASNGSGKSRYIDTHPSSYILDADAWMKLAGVSGYTKAAGFQPNWPLPSEAVTQLSRVLQASNYTTIFSQYAMPWMTEAVRRSGRIISTVTGIIPDIAVTQQRLWVSRGWDYATTARKLERFQKTLNDWQVHCQTNHIPYSELSSLSKLILN